MLVLLLEALLLRVLHLSAVCALLARIEAIVFLPCTVSKLWLEWMLEGTASLLCSCSWLSLCG